MPDGLPRIEIYTDGGCKPNPGPGGWGAVFVQGRRVVRELCGGEPRTTNNRMELAGAIAALEALDAPHEVVLHTDSRYVENGITQWIDGWRRRGWVTSERQPVLNRDLWERLDAAAARHRVRWAWVRGHAGNRHNERADRLATRGRRSETRARVARAEAAPDIVHLYAAAAYSGATDAGGYGVVLRFGETRKVLAGRASGTTANRMQLLSVIEGLRALKRQVTVQVYTPSAYVRDGATRWLQGWRERGWRTKDGKPVDHRDLWEQLDALQRGHEVRWPEIDGARTSDMEAAKDAARADPDADPRRA